MSARCSCSASSSVSSCPAVVGSLKSGALSPTCSTRKSLGGGRFQHVPAQPRRARDGVTTNHGTAQRAPERSAPRTRERGVGTAQGDDVLGDLTYKDASGRLGHHRLAGRADREDGIATPPAQRLYVRLSWTARCCRLRPL